MRLKKDLFLVIPVYKSLESYKIIIFIVILLLSHEGNTTHDKIIVNKVD